MGGGCGRPRDDPADHYGPSRCAGDLPRYGVPPAARARTEPASIETKRHRPGAVRGHEPHLRTAVWRHRPYRLFVARGGLEAPAFARRDLGPHLGRGPGARGSADPGAQPVEPSAVLREREREYRPGDPD